jgi:hypothetical protein
MSALLFHRHIRRINFSSLRRSTTQPTPPSTTTTSTVVKSVAETTATAATTQTTVGTATAAAAAVAEPKVPLMKQFTDYLKTIYRDYKDVAVHTVKTANDKPFTALGYGLLLSALLVFYKKNPSMQDYVDVRRDMFNEILMCGSTYSKRSHFYLKELNRLDNLEQLEYRSFVLFSVIMVKKFSARDATYEKNCAQLNTPNKYSIFNLPNRTLLFISRIIDVGFCDEWYFLNKNMRDFDVDEQEWLPKSIQQ